MAKPFKFRFRLNCVDHYQGSFTEFDPPLIASTSSQIKDAPAVPVIRAFGATETGQKVCAHIHGSLPYLYIQYLGSLEHAEVEAYIRDLRMSVDHALAVSYRRNAYDAKSSTFVGHISLVKGVPFFGYHVGYKFFLKIYLLNPLYMTRFADLLYQGAILKQVFQPYESHMQYLAQWMCDYNLYGCAYIDCRRVKFRGPIPDEEELSNSAHDWHNGTIEQHMVSDNNALPKQSHCSLEVDIRVEDIMNRFEIRVRPIHHNFVERFIQLGPEDKFVASMAGLWRDETKRRKRRMGLSDPSSSPFPPEVLVSMSAEKRASQKGGWIHEEEYRQMVEELVRGEKSTRGDKTLQFDDFVRPVASENHVQSALESVGDLYLENFKDKALVDTQLQSAGSNSRGTASGRPVADEADVSYLDAIQGPDSDEETAKEKALSQLDAGGAKSHSFGQRGHAEFSPSSRPWKRRRIDTANPGKLLQKSPLKHITFQDFPEQTSSSSQKSSLSQDGVVRKLSFEKLSQGSIKAHGSGGPGTLAFPTVKHPHDPDTKLRLSQRSEYSNSQEGQNSRAGKDKSGTASTVTRPSSLNSGSKASATPPFAAKAIALAAQLGQACGRSTCLLYAELPPQAAVVNATLSEYNLPQTIYQEAYYSNEKDVPERLREYAGKEFKLESDTLPFLPDFDPTGNSAATFGERPGIVLNKTKELLTERRHRQKCALRNWQIATQPPSRLEIKKWLEDNTQPLMDPGDPDESYKKPVQKGHSRTGGNLLPVSQVEGPTQKNPHGFKYSQKTRSTSVQHETQYMSIMSLEVHVNTRGVFVPDPAEDAVQAIFWCIETDQGNLPGVDRLVQGVLVLSDADGAAASIAKQTTVDVEYESDELELINRMVGIVRQYDPDILTGYEVHNSSWGYLIERARTKYEYNICDEFSRMKSQSHGRFGKEADRWGFNHTSTIRVTGRHMINIWRAMRGELNLLQYTLENVAFHLLHKRVPHYSFADLTRWYQSERPRDLARTLQYFLLRIQLNIQILEANEIIPRTSEQARLLGVDFFSVLSRGSQFKVESLMFRIAKPENFILVSPSRKQVGQQNALECLPLVMEPQSAFYSSPLLVLDFQSLYPSVMIAYNYCYSTFLGRIVSWRGQNKMGFTDFKREPGLLELVKDYVNIAPNGIMYVRPEMRKSLLAKMLGEILETRVMVKSGMKVDRHDKTLQQLLNNRQLALKLIANVTYGYTSASFSGRMPCSEIADSIVQTARETLEKAIALIHSVKKWNAEVVYGDTDSLFVYLKGRTRAEAFKIGDEIAATITKANPRPVKLKFEKVYHPCVLLAKKRYVGFKYESPSQTEPEFDAKGIETVRRDGTPAEQKIEEKALKILFRSQDLSEVKSYFQNQCHKIMSGHVSIQDFLFAKEVKLGHYSDKGPPPPGALIATRRMLADPRLEPQYGERVPYVVVTGAPGARLIDRCVDPEKLLRDDGGELSLDAEYYIGKNLIPPLERIFNLVGANVRAWFDEMPKVQRVRHVAPPLETGTGGAAAGGAGGAVVLRKTLEGYMRSSACLICRDRLPPITTSAALAAQTELPLPLCATCAARSSTTLLELRRRLRRAEVKIKQVEAVCRGCAGLAFGDEVRCDSRDCPVFYTRLRERSKRKTAEEVMVPVVRTLEEKVKGTLEW